MRKNISVFIVFVLLFINLYPGLAFAEENQTVSNDLYSIEVPSWAKVLSSSEDISVISDDNLSFTAKISFEEVTQDDISAVREYLSDSTSDDNKIFDSIIDLKAKSYEAVEKSYTNSNSFYPVNANYSELNFKIIDQKIQDYFGVRTFSIMYNTLDATMNRISEMTKVDIYIPSYNKGVYEINISIPRDNVNIDTAVKISELLTATKLADHSEEDKAPIILVSKDNIKKAAAGIYPAYTFKNYDMKQFYSKEMGISFYYPEFFILTDNVTSFNDMKTASFKIDPYTTFNVMTADSKVFSLNDAVASAFTSIDKDAVVKKSTVLDSPEGSIYMIIYTFVKNDIKYEKRVYALSSNGTTVVYSMLTSKKSPSYSLDNIAIRVLITTKTFKDTDCLNSVSSDTYKAYDLDKVTFNLPQDFKMQYTGDNSYKITSSDISTFQIYVYEEELTKDIDFKSASKLANSDNSIIQYGFTTPYRSTQNILINGRVYYDQDYIKIYRMSKYLDINNRLHYCYIVSLAEGDKMYSMLIDVNSMLFKEDGRVGSTMPGILNNITQSFKFK